MTMAPAKSDLAVAALDADWRRHRAQLDGIFSPTVPPLERLERYFDFNYDRLVEIKNECGAVLGCPLYALGSEICTQDTVLRSKIQEILDKKVTYLESAIRDAHARGPDRSSKRKSQGQDALHVHPGSPHPGPNPEQRRDPARYLSRRSRPLGRRKG